MSGIDWKRRAENYRALLIECRSMLVTCTTDTAVDLMNPARRRCLDAIIEKISIATEG